MKKKISKSLLMTTLITGLCFGVVQDAFAAEKLQEFTLDPMIVTATRTEKRDLDVPASTTVLTYQDIVSSGATNALEAISKINGVDFETQLPGNIQQTSMYNDVNIRGFGKGTLILVNGNPLNLTNSYSVDAIPAETIERIEVIKGAGSVLYGSEAMAGVINIITKRGATNKISVGFGNYGQEKYNLSAGNEKFKVNYDLQKWGEVENAKLHSGTWYTVHGIDSENIGIGYNFDDKLSIEYNHMLREVDYSQYHVSNGKFKQWRESTVKQDLLQLNYNDETFKGHMWYNQHELNYWGTNYAEKNRKASTVGVDVQKDLYINDNTLLSVGADFRTEKFHNRGSEAGKLERNQIGAFAQLDHKFTDKDSVIVGGRGTWTANTSNNGQTYDNFSASAQYLHKFDENRSFYASASESFVLPSFNQMFPSTWQESLSNPNLRPQEGINYEMGFKEISGNHIWKIALFNMDITDNISGTYVGSAWQYTNSNFKNTGLEASLKVDASDKFDYDLGFIVQNPKYEKIDADGNSSGWYDQYGKYQITSGIGYKLDKFSAKFTGSYVWDRYSYNSQSGSYKNSPYFLTSLTATYSPESNSTFTLAINNLLDRDDITASTHKPGEGSRSTPTNFLLTYTYKF